VHGVRGKGPCRMRRHKRLCVHGRPQWCCRRHGEDDSCSGCSDMRLRC
jgi:hypothetical protein